MPAAESGASVGAGAELGLSSLRRYLQQRPGQPCIYVANHQLYGLDAGLILSRLYEDTGVMPRGLGTVRAPCPAVLLRCKLAY